MALSIPIISEFDGKGIKKAVAQFKQLETTGQKAGFVLKKAGQAAAIGFAAIGAAAVAAATAAWSFAKAALEDQKSQRQLAASLKAVTKATDAQIKSTEKWIGTTEQALGVADDQLRPALARLVRSTKDVQAAQKLLNIALDVSAATGKPLEQVVNALGKAYDGSNMALGRLGLGFSKAELKGMKFADVQKRLNDQFGGAAGEAAKTFEGRMQRLARAFDNIKESLGVMVVDLLTRFLDFGDKLATAYGKDGFAGALSLVNEQLQKMLMYDKNGKLNALGKTFNAILKAGNIFSRAGQFAYGVGFTLGGAAATPITGSEGFKRYEHGLEIMSRAFTGDQGTAGLLPLKARAPEAPKGPVQGPFNPIYVNIDVNGFVGNQFELGREITKALNTYTRRTSGQAFRIGGL